MNPIIDYESSKLLKNVIYVDCRSEQEYSEGTIDGAVSLPILNDIERQEVGKLYMTSPKGAKLLGIDYASHKIKTYFEAVSCFIKEGKTPVMFCQRGGYRSRAIVALFSSLDIRVYQLDGGYKSYRKHVIEKLSSMQGKHKFVVLQGNTGVGKTNILKSIKEQGYPVIDLEGLALNRGSYFGSVGLRGRSQKQFESGLLNQLESYDSEYIVIESESKRVGKVVLPDFIHEGILKGSIVLVKTSMDNRIDNLIDDYIGKSGNEDKSLMEIRKGLHLLRKRLGNQVVDELDFMLSTKDYRNFVRVLLETYYDPLYKYSQDNAIGTVGTIEYSRIDEAVEDLKIILDEMYGKK